MKRNKQAPPPRVVSYGQMRLDEALPRMDAARWAHWLRCSLVPLDCKTCLVTRLIVLRAQRDAA